jgi:lysophospholipase L1-like esterase
MTQLGPESIRYAALGDSITAGFGDPLPSGEWRGFAALLAESLPNATFHNLAQSGGRAHDVATEQLAEAQAIRPHVATVVVGSNDMLRGAFDLKAIGAYLRATVDGLRAMGTEVVTACLPEPGKMLRLPESLARPLGRRTVAVNRLIHAVSEDTAHVHLADDPLVAARTMWSIDRLHPSEAGHRRLAGLFHDALLDR